VNESLLIVKWKHNKEEKRLLLLLKYIPTQKVKIPLAKLYHLDGAEEVMGYFLNADMLQGRPQNPLVAGQAFQEIKCRLEEKLRTRIWLTHYMNPDVDDIKKSPETDKTTVIINSER